MRLVLSGDAEPNPEFALPEPGISSNTPPLVLALGTGPFAPGTYLDLGYDYYEVWCIGAAGGRGGDIPPIPNPDAPEWYGVPTLEVVSYGGEGGGGGLHKIQGLLVTLPEIVDITVGSAGADGSDGNQHMRWKVAVGPDNQTVIKGAVNVPGMTDGGGSAIPPYFFTELSPYLYYLNPYYVAPLGGHDGGPSIFGALCRASGGKGGGPTPVYRNDVTDNDPASVAVWTGPGGSGGQGGVGVSIVAGGGATEAQDGTWTGSVGKGGGGGRGGSYVITGHDTRPSAPQQWKETKATRGGNGSFSYGDTSVYGPRGLATEISVPSGTAEIVPGFAGGAKALASLLYGSKVGSYSPQGVVAIKLMRVN